MNNSLYTTVEVSVLKTVFKDILLRLGLTLSQAEQCAEVFAANSIDGVYTHGVNRFPKFVEYIRKGLIDVNATPTFSGGFGAIEQWNGNLGIGVLNAMNATTRSMALADANGLGCVAMANTNHWMRGGYYGWMAAKQGYAFIGWTNTIGVMPAWNAKDARLGNNPFVLAVPYNDEAIVLDMAMSQFSYGAMELAAMKGEKLSVPGGYDEQNNLTQKPEAILASRRSLPIGYWKGAGLALLLDILAAILSNGLATKDISKQDAEYGVSQVFICIKLSKLNNYTSIAGMLQGIIEDYLQSNPSGNKSIVYPGQRVLATRTSNLKNGVPVLTKVWESILEL